MTLPFPFSRLALAGVLTTIAGGLGWLMFGYAGDRTGQMLLDAQGGGEIHGLPDPGNVLSIEKIRALEPGAWKSSKHASIYFQSGEVLWLRIVLHNPGATPLNGVLSTGCYFIDRLDAWPAGADASAGTPGHQVAGERIPEREKTLRGRDAAVAVSVPPRGDRVVFLRIEDACGGVMRPSWWPEARDYFAACERTLLAEGVYFGGLFALLAYNLVLWLRLRFPDTGSYVLYLCTVLVFLLLACGHLPVAGWTPGSPALDTAVVVVTFASAFFLAQFARLFLQLGGKFPRTDRVVRGWQLVLAAGAAGALTVPWTDYSRWMGLACGLTVGTHLLLLAVAVRAGRAGVRQARFFMLSFGCLFAGVLPLIYTWLSGAAVPDAGMFGLMIGSAMEMLLLSLALADRFVQAQNERAEAQARLIEEVEQRRAIQEAYADELAFEVRERTKELEAANADKDRMIAVIGHDLRSPLTSLMQTAEQLTGAADDPAALRKFAADSSQVGRETLLLIEDLVLWSRLRAGLRQPPGRHQVRVLVAPVVALHRASAGRRGVELAVAVPEGLALATDLVLAQTLLRNLVANALRFARSRVVVSAVEEAGGVRLTVGDDGPGLPAAVLAALTREFPEPASVEQGLGLRLCVEISRALGVRLEVRQPPGAGTEFTFILPL